MLKYYEDYNKNKHNKLIINHLNPFRWSTYRKRKQVTELVTFSLVLLEYWGQKNKKNL